MGTKVGGWLQFIPPTTVIGCSVSPCVWWPRLGLPTPEEGHPFTIGVGQGPEP